MCPSYMVTHEERHSTRGRSRLLFEMLRGEVIQGGWREDSVLDALDLCLSCKGCKGDCPVNVDMATYKAEFLSHYYQGRIRPRHAYAIGHIHRWARRAFLARSTFSRRPPFWDPWQSLPPVFLSTGECRLSRTSHSKTGSKNIAGFTMVMSGTCVIPLRIPKSFCGQIPSTTIFIPEPRRLRSRCSNRQVAGFASHARIFVAAGLFTTMACWTRRGARIGLIARGHDGLEGAQADVQNAGGAALALSADVARYKEVEKAAETVERELGPIDVWVNNAMTTVFSPFTEITADEFKRATEVTYLGTVYGTMVALKKMRARNQGCIVQVGSALAYRSIPLQAPYCGAKHAIRGFTDSIRCELLHNKSKIHLTMVQLPALNTPQFSWCKTRLPRHPQPVPPIFQPEVAAEAIVWASHHRRREVYVGGSTAEAIIGNKAAPSLLDRRLAESGYDAQQTGQPVSPDRPDNLFDPLPGDRGEYGIFNDCAHLRSIRFWETSHRA